jgi:hypothetical protein
MVVYFFNPLKTACVSKRPEVRQSREEGEGF